MDLDQPQRIAHVLEAIRHDDDVEIAADLVADEELVVRVGPARARDRLEREILPGDRAFRERPAERVEPVAERASPIEDRARMAGEIVAFRPWELGDDPRHEVARLRRAVVALPFAELELIVEERARIDVVGEQNRH
jgi:hypothetical protein